MLKILPGSFTRQTGGIDEQGNNRVNQEQVVNMTRPYLLSDREVTVGMFEEFVNDETYPANPIVRPIGNPVPDYQCGDGTEFDWREHRCDGRIGRCCFRSGRIGGTGRGRFDR